LELVPTTAEGWPDEEHLLERLRDPRVRVLAVSLVQFSNGYTVDLARLSAATRDSGTYLVVDAIQGVGQVPVDVRKTPVDLLACGAQKWLLSPWGSGFVYVRRELVRELRPAITGWMAFEGTDDFTRLTQYNDTLRGDARRFELITLPYQDFAGMNASLDLLLALGIPRIRQHLRQLHAPLFAWAGRSGARVVSPAGERGSGILCVAPSNVGEAFRGLKAAHIICSMREGAIRLSPHAYNSLEEMERVVSVLEKSPS
jgi:cysteine desulfurase/selenocysteine lyase